jgi:hypothetical protein
MKSILAIIANAMVAQAAQVEAVNG